MRITTLEIKSLFRFLIASMFFGFLMNDFNWPHPSIWMIFCMIVVLIRGFVFLREKNY